MATTPRGIVSPDSSDGYDLIVDLGIMADTIDDAIDAAVGTLDTDVTALQGDVADLETATGVKDYRWANTTARNAQAGMAVGDRGYQENTDVDYWYSGSAWLANMPGLNLVVPTGVGGAGVSLSGRGTVTTSGSTSCSINGCFTSRFTNYKIVFDHSGTTTVTMVLRASGSNSTSAYDSQRLYSNNATTTSSQALNQSSWVVTPSGLTARTVGTIELFQPAVATPTLGKYDILQTENPMTSSALYWTGGLQHRTATAYDGFNISAASGFTGTVRVYGYNE